MRLKQFHDLCKKEWNGHKGDVRTMWLVEDSYRELHEDAQRFNAEGETDIYLDESRTTAVKLSVLVNPYTRTVVKMRLARDTDVAEVWFSDGHFETRFLDLVKAAELGLVTA